MPLADAGVWPNTRASANALTYIRLTIGFITSESVTRAVVYSHLSRARSRRERGLGVLRDRRSRYEFRGAAPRRVAVARGAEEPLAGLIRISLIDRGYDGSSSRIDERARLNRANLTRRCVGPSTSRTRTSLFHPDGAESEIRQ